MWYPNPIPQYLDDNGDPLTGGLLYTYINGTTTAKTTYSDADLTVANSNPIVLNSRGETDDPIFGFGYYKFILKDSDGVEIWSADDLWGIGCCSKTLSFDDTDLDGSNNLTITHEYGKSHLRVTVFDEDDRITEVGWIDCTSTTEIIINFGLMTLTGTWTVRYGL